jgi:hypothetical protein
MLNNEFPPLGGGTGVVNRQLLIEFARRGDVQSFVGMRVVGRACGYLPGQRARQAHHQRRGQAIAPAWPRQSSHHDTG